MLASILSSQVSVRSSQFFSVLNKRKWCNRFSLNSLLIYDLLRLHSLYFFPYHSHTVCFLMTGRHLFSAIARCVFSAIQFTFASGSLELLFSVRDDGLYSLSPILCLSVSPTLSHSCHPFRSAVLSIRAYHIIRHSRSVYIYSQFRTEFRACGETVKSRR